MYNSYSQYLKKQYGEKVYKLPVNLPVTCPNRQNGNHGCAFCAGCGTGFEAMEQTVPVTTQLLETKAHIEKNIMLINSLHIFKIIQIHFCLWSSSYVFSEKLPAYRIL